MRVMRFLGICLVVVLLSATPASARDMTGIYIATGQGLVEYFNLTDVNGQLSGYYQEVSVNMNSRDGLSRANFSVSGIANGSRLILDLNGASQGMLSGRSFSWTADVQWNGNFVLNVPQTSGQINQVSFHRSSVDEVNRLVGALTQTGNTAKYYSNAQAELTDSESRLDRDLGLRPMALQQIVQAKAALTRALQVEERANQRVQDKQSIADQKHADANQAQQDAQSVDDHVRASQMQADAAAADAAVDSAKANLISARVQVDNVQRNIDSGNDYLMKLDARIAQLRQMIARDKSVLHQP